MPSLDDFRRNDEVVDNSATSIDAILDAREASVKPRNKKFMGMTPAERAFLSVIIFFVVLILGLGLLIITNRVVLPA